MRDSDRKYNLVFSAIVGLVLAAAVILCFEVVTIHPVYRKEMATVINVQDDDPWGYIGEQKKTLVQFADKSRQYVPGAMGKPGEEILVSRPDGSRSAFGLIRGKQK